MNPAKVDQAQAHLVLRASDKVVDDFPDSALEILAADLESDTEDLEG
jgi:hypothetical protein